MLNADRLNNVAKAESAVAGKKALNEEQLALMSSKPALERSLVDLEAIKTQLEEVAASTAAGQGPAHKKVSSSAVLHMFLTLTWLAGLLAGATRTTLCSDSDGSGTNSIETAITRPGTTGATAKLIKTSQGIACFPQIR
jgi:hypothetical protein